MRFCYLLSTMSALALEFTSFSEDSVLNAEVSRAFRTVMETLFSAHNVYGDLGSDHPESTIAPTDSLNFYYFPHDKLERAELPLLPDKLSASEETSDSLNSRSRLRTLFEKKWWLNPETNFTPEKEKNFTKTPNPERVAAIVSGLRESHMHVGASFRRFLLPALRGPLDFFLCGKPEWTWIKVGSLWLPVLASASIQEEDYWRQQLKRGSENENDPPSEDVRVVRFLIGGTKVVDEVYKSPDFENFVVTRNLQLRKRKSSEQSDDSWFRVLQGFGNEGLGLQNFNFFRSAINLAEKFVNGQYGRLDFCYRAARRFEPLKKNSYSHFIRLRPDLWFTRSFPPISLLPLDRVSLRARKLFTAGSLGTNDFRSFDKSGLQDGHAICNDQRGRNWGARLRCGFWSDAESKVAKWENEWEQFLEGREKIVNHTLQQPPESLSFKTQMPESLSVFDPYLKVSDPELTDADESTASHRLYLQSHGIPRCVTFDDQVWVAPFKFADSMFLLGNVGGGKPLKGPLAVAVEETGAKSTRFADFTYAREMNRTRADGDAAAVTGSYGVRGANHAFLRCAGVLGFRTPFAVRDLIRRRDMLLRSVNNSFSFAQERSIRSRDIAREYFRGLGRRDEYLFGLAPNEGHVTVHMYARSVPYTIMPLGVLLWKQLIRESYPTSRRWLSEVKLELFLNGTGKNGTGDIQKMMLSHW